MLWLAIFLAARALAATTHTVTILNDEPDRRTLGNSATTAAGDVVTYVTLYPDGVNADGQTRYVQHTGGTAGHSVTSFLSFPTSTSATETASGTLTQTLPWQQGHHIEIITVTEPDGTVHEVTRIDQQSTHVTVSPTTKPDGKTVLVSSNLHPTTVDVTTTTITAPSTDTREKLFDRRIRQVPLCQNDTVTWQTVDQACWPIYDMMIPTPPAVNTTRHSKCKRQPKETINRRLAYMPMNNATTTAQAASPAEATETAYVDISPHHEKRGILREAIKSSFKDILESQRDECAVIQDVIDYGTCGKLRVIAKQREYVHYHSKHKRSWIFRWWWVPLLALLGLFALCLLPCALCLRRRGREKNLQNEKAVTVVQEQPAAVAGAATGAAGGSTTGAGGGSTTGAGGAGPTTTGGTTATGTAPAGTAAPAEVVTTTTTEPANANQGTMRRAAEEGRAGQRVRFDGQSADTSTPATHQVDGTAELRTGSEVFDVGSMRGRKRNRGDEPL